MIFDPVSTQLTAFRVHTEISDFTGVQFTDDRFIARWSPDPQDNIMGFTGKDGSLVSADSTGFPSLFGIPEMPLTSEFGDILASFTYADSIRIVLTDTTSAQDPEPVNKFETLSF